MSFESFFSTIIEKYSKKITQDIVDVMEAPQIQLHVHCDCDGVEMELFSLSKNVQRFKCPKCQRCIQIKMMRKPN